MMLNDLNTRQVLIVDDNTVLHSSTMSRAVNRLADHIQAAIERCRARLLPPLMKAKTAVQKPVRRSSISKVWKPGIFSSPVLNTSSKAPK